MAVRRRVWGANGNADSERCSSDEFYNVATADITNHNSLRVPVPGRAGLSPRNQLVVAVDVGGQGRRREATRCSNRTSHLHDCVSDKEGGIIVWQRHNQGLCEQQGIMGAGLVV